MSRILENLGNEAESEREKAIRTINLTNKHYKSIDNQLMGKLLISAGFSQDSSHLKFTIKDEAKEDLGKAFKHLEEL